MLCSNNNYRTNVWFLNFPQIQTLPVNSSNSKIHCKWFTRNLNEGVFKTILWYQSTCICIFSIFCAFSCSGRLELERSVAGSRSEAPHFLHGACWFLHYTLRNEEESLLVCYGCARNCVPTDVWKTFMHFSINHMRSVLFGARTVNSLLFRDYCFYCYCFLVLFWLSCK